MTRILLIDDDLNILKSLKRCLRLQPWEIDIYTDTNEALSAISNFNYHVIVSDYKMPQMNGIEFMNLAKTIQPNAVRLMLSGQKDLDVVIESINQASVYRFITKPWNDVELVTIFNQAIKYQALTEENQRLANQVRKQRQTINAQTEELHRLEKETPGITQVEWDDDGCIILESE